MSGLAGKFLDAVDGLGQSFLVSCCLPAALFLLVNQLLLWPMMTASRPPPPPVQAETAIPSEQTAQSPAADGAQAETPTGNGAPATGQPLQSETDLVAQILSSLTQLTKLDLEALPGMLLWSLLIGLVLSALNNVIVRGFEGKLPWLRYGLLVYWTKRNQQRTVELYGELVKLQTKYRELGAKLALEPEPDQQSQLQGYLGVFQQKLIETYAIIEEKAPIQTLPHTVDRVAPTNFGNIYAMAEEYPYERYGVDSVLFWPRLRGLMLDHPAAQEHSARITGQKTALDLALNFALLSALLGVEAFCVLFLAQACQNPIVWVVLVGGLLLAVAFYHAAIAAVAVLGELIKMSFDYYRHLLLESFNLQKPADLHREQLMWVQLAAFIRRGDEFYFPAYLSSPPTAST